MANRVRPRCNACQKTMKPVFAKRPRGEGYLRVRDSFWCPADGTLARGRRKVDFLESR